MDRPLAIDFVLEKLRIFASVRPGILVEEKTLGAGLHFRLAPQYEADCLSFCMQLADETGLYLQRGKMLFELRPGHAGKGSAVTHLLKATELGGGLPIFIGDEIGRAHVCTPVTTAHLVCRLLLEIKYTITTK